MHLISYLNPFSERFTAYIDFKEKLSIDQKIKTIVITLFFGILSLPFLCIGAVAAFRLMVERYTFKKIEPLSDQPTPKERISEVVIPMLQPETPHLIAVTNQHQLFPAQVTPIIEQTRLFPIIEEPNLKESKRTPSRPPLSKEKRSRSLSYMEQEQLSQFNPEQLKEYITSLDIKLLEAFWKRESQQAGSAKNRQDLEEANKRLPIILEALSHEQFKKSIKLSFFWTILSNPRYNRDAINHLHPHHFAYMAERVRKVLITGNVALKDEYKDSAKCLGTLIGLIPNSLNKNYLPSICKVAIPEWELVLKGKIRHSGEKKAELEKSLEEALKNFPKIDEPPLVAPSVIKLKAPGYAGRRWSAPAARPHITPDTFKEPEKYSIKLSEEACMEYFHMNDFLSQIPHNHQEDLFFWCLKHFDELTLEKNKSFILSYFCSQINPEEYPRLEKLHRKELQHLITTLDEKGLFILWKQEKCALSSIKGEHEIERLRKLLGILFETFSEIQFKASIELDAFWGCMIHPHYKATVAQFLTAEQIGWMAKLISLSSDSQNRILYFGDLIQELKPKGEILDYRVIDKKVVAILPHVTSISPIMDKLIYIKGAKWIKAELAVLAAKREEERLLDLELESVNKELAEIEMEIGSLEESIPAIIQATEAVAVVEEFIAAEKMSMSQVAELFNEPELSISKKEEIDETKFNDTLKELYAIEY